MSPLVHRMIYELLKIRIHQFQQLLLFLARDQQKLLDFYKQTNSLHRQKAEDVFHYSLLMHPVGFVKLIEIIYSNNSLRDICVR